MAKKSKTDYFKNFSNNPELEKKIFKQGDVDWSDIKERPSDYYDASSGSVPGMIYYTDTVKFAKKNHLEILQVLQEFEDDCGPLSNKPKPTDETQYFNWMAWFAWENMMGNIMSYLEQ